MIVTTSSEAARRLQAPLERQGHHVRVTSTVRETLPLVLAQRVDLIVAECRLLEAHGAALFHLLGHQPHVPVILPLTMTSTNGADALAPAADPSLCSRAGMERLQAVVAQAQTLLAQGDDGTLRVGDLVIDMPAKRVRFRGQHVAMPPIQFRLLAYLVKNAGRVVGAQELLKAVWGYEGDENEARELVKVHVRQIRRRLGLGAQHADYVQSVRGFGYQVTAPGE